MAAQIITVTEIGVSGVNIKIKINDGHPIPNSIIGVDSVQSFRTWVREDDHIFIWTDDSGNEISMVVLYGHIGWIIASRPIESEGDRFRIDVPCSVVIETEQL